MIFYSLHFKNKICKRTKRKLFLRLCFNNSTSGNPNEECTKELQEIGLESTTFSQITGSKSTLKGIFRHLLFLSIYLLDNYFPMIMRTSTKIVLYIGGTRRGWIQEVNLDTTYVWTYPSLLRQNLQALYTVILVLSYPHTLQFDIHGAD